MARDLIQDPTNVLLVCDHHIVREGLTRTLAAHSAPWAIRETASASQALEELSRHACDLIILHSSMQDFSALSLINRLKRQYPAVPVLVLGMHKDEQHALRAFRAGANGYLTKDSRPVDLLNAANRILDGGAFGSEQLAERLVLQLNGDAKVPTHEELSDRELEVLRRIATGQRPIDVARSLNLSIKTVSTHKRRILEKLALPNTAALIRYALEQQIDLGDLN